jgi:hypothetical protein
MSRFTDFPSKLSLMLQNNVFPSLFTLHSNITTMHCAGSMHPSSGRFVHCGGHVAGQRSALLQENTEPPRSLSCGPSVS